MARQAGSEYQPNAWSLVLAFVTVVLLIGTGLILMLYGFSELMWDDLGDTTHILVNIGPKGWGVIHLTLGATLILAGCNLVVGHYWGRVVGIIVASVALIAGLMSLDANSFWAIGLIVLNLGILWALVTHWKDIELISR
jgi:hypothetical protein